MRSSSASVKSWNSTRVGTPAIGTHAPGGATVSVFENGVVTPIVDLSTITNGQ